MANTVSASAPGRCNGVRQRAVHRPALVFSAALGLACLTGCSPGGEVYPDRPIRLICPWAVGGGTDRLSRQLAPFLEAELALPVIVINVPGGGGVTGHSRGARARPDGYTLTMLTVEINMLHWRRLTRISWQDFEPLALINRDPAALFVRSDDDRYDSLDALLRDVQQRPGALVASGTAAGGIWHLALAGALHAAAVDPAGIRWVPMNGAAPALQELVSGGLDLVASSLPEAETFLASGRIRSLGVMAEARVSAFPGIPTFTEQGIHWSLGSWRGLGVPTGTPAPVRDRLSLALARIVEGRTIVNGRRFPELMAHEGFSLWYESPASFRRTLARTDAELGRLLTSEALSTVQTERFDALAFPRLLFLALGATLLALWAKSLRAPGGARSAVPARAAAGPWHLWDVVAAVLLYLLVAEWLGFILTSATILFFLLWRFGNRLVVCASVTALLVPAMYALFATLLRVPLPRGLVGW